MEHLTWKRKSSKRQQKYTGLVSLQPRSTYFTKIFPRYVWMFHFWALGFIGLEFFLPRCLSRSLNVYQQTVSNPDSNSIQLGEAINELSSDQDVPPSPIKVQVFISSIIPCRWEPTSCQRALIHNRFRLIREGGIRLSFFKGTHPPSPVRALYLSPLTPFP